MPSSDSPHSRSHAVRQVVDLAWPIAAAMIGETAIGLVDTKLVGGISAVALAGVGVATTLTFLGYSFILGVMRGLKVRAAFAVGRGTPEDGARYAQAGLVMSAIFGVLVWWACRDVSSVLRLLDIDEALIDPAREFLAARTFGAPATCMVAAFTQYRHAVGDSRTPMVTGIVGNIVNALLAYGLIHGAFGLPALGIRGAGFGTAITEWLELAAMAALFSGEIRAGIEQSRKTFASAVVEVVDLGLPTGIQFGAETLAFTAFTAILGSMGTVQMAANQIALAVNRVSFLPGVAIAEAVSVLVGQALGARDVRGAERVTRAALAVAVSFMAVCAVGFALFGGPVARVFTSDATVALVAQKLLLVAAVFQVLDAVSIVLRGALRGAKDVRAVAVIGTLVVWTCVPGLAYFFGKHLGWGAVGGWIGFVAETSVGAAVFWMRWKQGAWRADYPPAAAESSPDLIGHGRALS